MARDVGAEFNLRVTVDATAGKGIASRRCLGKIRHLRTPSLWAQKVYHERRVEVRRVPGPENPSDLGTTVLGAKEVWKTLTDSGFRARQGRSELALRAAG